MNMKSYFNNKSEKRSVTMDDKIQEKLNEWKCHLKKIYDLWQSKEFRVQQQKLFLEKVKYLIHDMTHNPLLRQYYSYQCFGWMFSYFVFVMLSFFTLTPRYGLTIRIFFPHYLTLLWLLISIGLGILLYKLNHFYHYQVVMREKIVANGEKGSADWANDTIQELMNDHDKLLEHQGLVTVPIYFKTLEELEEEKNYLENEIQKLQEQLKIQPTREEDYHETNE